VCPYLEKLPGVPFNCDKKEITIQVISTGCKARTDFLFKISNNNISIIRKKKDLFKAMPQATSITYTLQEAGINPDKTYTIKNRFIANPFLANIP